MASHAAARYYDSNTRVFLRFGGGLASGSIHRQLWGDGVTTTAAAADFINVLLGDAIGNVRRSATGIEPASVPGNRTSAERGSAPGITTVNETGNAAEDATAIAAGIPTANAVPVPDGIVLDLGCGVGGTLRALATRFPLLRCYGVTISERQTVLAERMNAGAGLAERCRIVNADFESVRLDVEADVIIAIESFVHSLSARRFFDTVAAHLRPGGRLFLIDDFLGDDFADPQKPGAGTTALADRFRAGWRAPAFCAMGQCAAEARAAGLELAASRDLSALIRLDRPRDRVIALIAPLLGLPGLERLPICGNWLGGAALRRGLAAGAFGYRWLEFVPGMNASGSRGGRTGNGPLPDTLSRA